jgi:DNA processing protein
VSGASTQPRSPEERAASAVRTTPDDATYPASLADLEQPPRVLWATGHWGALTGPVISIVGTRRATAYGERVTRELAGALARAGACVVSGMARGVDAAAHRAALDVGGRTVAVLGTGVDIAYPTGHRALHQEIATRGLLLSELPPGARSHAGSFPRRNRIIAALGVVTIVVEAPVKSGALITADHALTLGRTVAAVPGPIDSPQSEGSNALIRDGAVVITSAAEAVTLAGLTPPCRSTPELDDEAASRLWEQLEVSAPTLDALCARAGLPVRECLAAVTALELRGYIECSLTGEIRRR